MHLRRVFWWLNTAEGKAKMKNPVVGVVVAIAVLAVAPLAFSYEVDRNVFLTYGDNNKNYTETYFDDIVKGLDISSLTKAILTVYLRENVDYSTAQIWVNGDLVESRLRVPDYNVWSYDALSDLQNDNALNFKVEKLSGTMYYLGATLDVQQPSATHNPLPGTLGLFGCGLIAFAGLRRRFGK